MNYNDIAIDITKDIIGDITMRSGLGDVWLSIDRKTQDDIIKEWKRIIAKELKYHLE
jgi:hypothetical protein